MLKDELSWYLAHVTEQAAIAAAQTRGLGDEMHADAVAVDAMRRALNELPIDGHVVIGEGERDAAPMLYSGERVGTGAGAATDIALDPLEGTTICAKNLPNSLTVIAAAPPGCLLRAPDFYMDKIAIGPGYRDGTIDLDASIEDNLTSMAREKNVAVKELSGCVLDRPRHADLIARIRAMGAAIRLIGDGDIAAIIDTTDPAKSGTDFYAGIGGAPEGVLAAAALACVGGQMQARLILSGAADIEAARRLGIEETDKKYTREDLARGAVVFSATGVTSGNMLKGVEFDGGIIRTHTLVMQSAGISRRIETTHTR